MAWQEPKTEKFKSKIQAPPLLLLQLFYDPLSGTTQVIRYQKDKPFWILLKQSDGVAVASAEPYASYLHFTAEDNHAGTHYSQDF